MLCRFQKTQSSRLKSPEPASGYMREKPVRRVSRERETGNRQSQREKSPWETGKATQHQEVVRGTGAEMSRPVRLCPCKPSLLSLRGKMVVGVKNAQQSRVQVMCLITPPA